LIMVDTDLVCYGGEGGSGRLDTEGFRGRRRRDQKVQDREDENDGARRVRRARRAARRTRTVTLDALRAATEPVKVEAMQAMMIGGCCVGGWIVCVGMATSSAIEEEIKTRTET
jgi:hypothetical protein